MLRNILLGVGLFAAILSLLIFSGKIPLHTKQVVAQGTVVLWGTLPETQMNPIIQAFNPQAKTYAVRYTYVPEAEFDQRLLEALASGIGPDLIMTPYQTILAQRERISPFSMSANNFKNTYVDGATVLYDDEAGAIGLPISVEPMVLFYNRTLFSKHGIVNPPQYWDEVVSMVPTLTIKQNGRFVESGIALGTPSVSYAKDIIMAIIGQLGQVPVVKIPQSQGGPSYMKVTVNDAVTTDSQILPLATAVRFYTLFGDPGQTTYSWSQTQEGSAADVFVSEKLAMYIGYTGEFAVLRARNPRADFEMTKLPQTRGYTTSATGMRMYAIAALKSSKNIRTANAVASEFSGGGVSPSLAPMVGGVSALRNYATAEGLDPVIKNSMLVARGWYDSHAVQSTEYIKAMISDIINYRQGVNDAASTFVSRLRDLYAPKQ